MPYSGCFDAMAGSGSETPKGIIDIMGLYSVPVRPIDFPRVGEW